MDAFFDFASGTLFWICFAVFCFGVFWRVWSFLNLVKAAEPKLFKGFRWTWALASLWRWILPFGVGAKENPASALAGYVFHISFFLLALFASGHAVLLSLGLDLDWPMLPTGFAYYLGLAGLAALAYFIYRRIFCKEVKALSEFSDWFVLVLAGFPLASGFMIANGIGEYKLMLCLHAASGDLLLLLLPFCKLSHMIFFFISRLITGSDFGKREVGAW